MRLRSLSFLFVAAFAVAAEGAPRQGPLQQQGPPPGQQQPPANPLQQLQGMITDLYVSDLRNAMELTDMQFLKLNPPLRRFMQQKFKATVDKRAVTEQIDRLAAQPTASQEEFQMLVAERSKFDRQLANADTILVDMIGMDLSVQQVARVLQFNKRFFEERLPKLIEDARRINAARPQQPPPQNRQQNQQNRPPNGPPNGPGPGNQQQRPINGVLPQNKQQ